LFQAGYYSEGAHQKLVFILDWWPVVVDRWSYGSSEVAVCTGWLTQGTNVAFGDKCNIYCLLLIIIKACKKTIALTQGTNVS
jgi:hypothetical protein